MADVAPANTEPTAQEQMQDNEEEDSEIALMKQRVAEMEAEAAKLREMQAEAEAKEAEPASPGTPMDAEDDKTLSDNRSVYVGNVEYAATPEDIQAHFQACGTINRVTILCDKFTGHPKGFAYVEFAEPEHVEAALALDNSMFHDRLIKVTRKRTNVPGFNRGRGRGGGGYRGGYRGGFRGGGGYNPYGGRGRGRLPVLAHARYIGHAFSAQSASGAPSAGGMSIRVEVWLAAMERVLHNHADEIARFEK